MKVLEGLTNLMLIKMNKIERLKCLIAENIQKMEIHNLTKKNNRNIVVNEPKKENGKLTI
ncbi:hypothetical protein LCGC14_3147180 [marine sediment metagenome]|uniref:Uncharacterized protein n=1 Tax=marine sediment metagenome TaxID=412755 RepID=A0A0F8YJG1_9ZZZZ